VSADPKATKGNWRDLRRVVAYLGRYPVAVAASLGLLLTILALEMAIPQVVGLAVDALRAALARGERDFGIGTYAWLLAAMALARAALAIVLGPIRNRLIQRVLADIRLDVLQAIHRLTFSYHDRMKSGELISRATTDVWRLQDFLFACLFLSLDVVVAILTTLVLIFFVSPVLGAVALLTIFPTLGLIALFAHKLQPQWRKVHDLHSAMTTVVQENVAGVRVVRAFAQEQAETGRFRAKKEEYLSHFKRTLTGWAVRVPLAQFVYALAVPVSLYFAGQAVLRGELLMGDLAKVILYLLAVGGRLTMVGQFTNILQNAAASSERVMEVIRQAPEIHGGTRPWPNGPGEVRFEGVSFHYLEGKPSLHEIDFIARPGTKVGVVGATGAGKTTLMHLIPRFYDPTAGRVSIDGVDVRDLELAPLRRSVGVIFQESFLFAATVAENIAFGRPEATREQIEGAARTAQAHEFILGLKQGYDTRVGERGITLSGGQKQRIAMARAFLLNPRILILDDATASVDSGTERLVREALRRLCAGRTTFVVANRLASITDADLILVLEGGRLVESGTHQELLARGGCYSRLFATQVENH
jgi:ATP-binding cassette subfamily B protein